MTGSSGGARDTLRGLGRSLGVVAAAIAIVVGLAVGIPWVIDLVSRGAPR